MLKIFLCVILSVCWSAAHAKASELTDLYRQKTIQVLKNLEKAKITKIGCFWGPVWGPIFDNEGCLAPGELIEELNQIKIIETNDFIKPSGATRWTAFFDPNSAVLYLNKRVSHDPTLAGFIGLHELLGAVRRADEEYQISAFAMLFLESKKRGLEILSNHYRANIEYDYSFYAQGDAVTLANNTLVTRSGGGTIIGGGGDEDALRVRTQVYCYLENFYSAPHFVPLRHPILLVEIVDEDGPEIRRDQVAQRDTKMMWDRFLVPRNLLGKPARFDIRAPSLVVEEIGEYLAKRDPLSNIGARNHD